MGFLFVIFNLLLFFTANPSYSTGNDSSQFDPYIVDCFRPTSADFDPIVVDCGPSFDPVIIDSPKHRRKIIEKFIVYQAQQCKIDTNKIKIGARILDEPYQGSKWAVDSNCSSASLPKQVSNAKLILGKEDANDLYQRLQKYQRYRLSPEDRNCLMQDIVFMRHEFGHIMDHPRRSRPSEIINKIAATTALGFSSLIGLSKVFNKFGLNDITNGSLILLSSLPLALILPGSADSLYCQYYESRADNFAIQHTHDPSELQEMANTFLDFHKTENRSYREKISQFIQGDDTHPSFYSRYLKFKNAAEKLNSRSKIF